MEKKTGKVSWRESVVGLESQAHSETSAFRELIVTYLCLNKVSVLAGEGSKGTGKLF